MSAYYTWSCDWHVCDCICHEQRKRWMDLLEIHNDIFITITNVCVCGHFMQNNGRKVFTWSASCRFSSIAPQAVWSGLHVLHRAHWGFPGPYGDATGGLLGVCTSTGVCSHGCPRWECGVPAARDYERAFTWKHTGRGGRKVTFDRGDLHHFRFIRCILLHGLNTLVSRWCEWYQSLVTPLNCTIVSSRLYKYIILYNPFHDMSCQLHWTIISCIRTTDEK